MYPTLFHFGNLYLPTFGVLAALGLMLALFLSERSAARAGAVPATLWEAGIFAVLAAFLLSRLLLIATHFSTFRAYPVSLLAVPSLTATGLLLTAIATGIWLYFKQVNLLRALDAWAPCAALVWAFLALGHFAEGSDPGMPTALPWHVHPVALYVAVIAGLLATASWVFLGKSKAPGTTAAFTLAAAGLAQFLLTFVRVPGEQSLFGLDLLQVVALGILLAGILLGLRTHLAGQRQ